MMREPVERTVAANAQGYLEVNLEFRIARAEALEADKVDARKDLNRCPVLDASRKTSAYGMMALPSTDQAGLDQWIEALKLPKHIIRFLAFSSGPLSSLVSNQITKSFDLDEVNTGIIMHMKKGVHTGIVGEGFYDQDAFDDFITTLHPDLKGTAIDNDFLHSTDAEGYYVGNNRLKAIMTYNKEQSNALFKGMGLTISTTEMGFLLINRLGQDVTLNPEEKREKTIQAISVRDMHDLYKYGVFPAFVEDRLLAAGLIDESSVALTGVSSS
jgi:hypothetical protein